MFQNIRGCLSNVLNGRSLLYRCREIALPVAVTKTHTYPCCRGTRVRFSAHRTNTTARTSHQFCRYRVRQTVDSVCQYSAAVKWANRVSLSLRGQAQAKARASGFPLPLFFSSARHLTGFFPETRRGEKQNRHFRFEIELHLFWRAQFELPWIAGSQPSEFPKRVFVLGREERAEKKAALGTPGSGRTTDRRENRCPELVVVCGQVSAGKGVCAPIIMMETFPDWWESIQVWILGNLFAPSSVSALSSWMTKLCVFVGRCEKLWMFFWMMK